MSQPNGKLPARRPDDSQLLRLVPDLAPETLHQVIQHRGLDVGAELLAAATPAQVTGVLDLELWGHPAPGQDDQFDVDRFGEWVEALVDHDPAVAARIVATADTRVVVVGLSRYIRVFDPATLLPSAASDDEPIGLSDWPTGPSCDLGGYAIRAGRADTWDAILSLLGGLEADHPSSFHAVMQGCRQLSNRGRERDGLDAMLGTPAQMVHDMSAARAERRAAQGYSSPADARAFLELARQRGRLGAGRTDDVNPIARAHFRDSDEPAPARADGRGPITEHLLTGSPADADQAEAVESLLTVLAEAGVVLERPRALLADPGGTTSRVAVIRSMMTHLRDHDQAASDVRTSELAFLTNTLMAGCPVQTRAFTPQEASDAVVGICNLGLELWPERMPDARTAGADGWLPADFLVTHDLVTAFELGWAALYDDVSLFVADRLIATLGDLHIADAFMLRGVHEFRAALKKQTRAGTPWVVRDALDVLAPFDTPAWMSLLGIMDECPVIPAALTAVVERQTGAVSATAFEFISTRAQIDVVHRFMARLPDLLRG